MDDVDAYLMDQGIAMARKDEQLREYSVTLIVEVIVTAASQAEAETEALERARTNSADFYTLDRVIDIGPAQE